MADRKNNSAEEQQDAEESVQEESQETRARRSRGETSNHVIVSYETSVNDMLSGKIRENLEKEFERETAPAKSSSGDPVGESGSGDGGSARGQGTEDHHAPSAEQDTGSRGAEYCVVNIFEQIVGQPYILSCMKRQGMCTCSRCQADVRALTLSKLPAKYVVVPAGGTSPMIGFYQTRYQAEILSAVMQASEMVQASPRHGGIRNT